jgi:hypothetical protein
LPLSATWNGTYRLGNNTPHNLQVDYDETKAPQTDFEPKYPGPNYTLEPFNVFAAAWYTTLTPENKLWDATSKPQSLSACK